MIVENKTHYFSEYTRVYNVVPDQNSFSVQSSKRMGYFQRLWFEYAYCRKVNGMCFYYTLTYNNKSIPKYRGRNCFSYADIRYITNGALSKWLLRNYGSKLRYFCACETGEGKGVRGLGNNPHYHFIFYVLPADNEKYPYKRITSQEFKDYIYTLWQGAPSNKFVPWQLAKFGHVQEGLYNGEVLSPEAFKYVGKYVVKEHDEQLFESDLRKQLVNECLKFGINTRVLWYYYKYLLWTDSGVRDKYDFLEMFPIRQYWKYRKEHSSFNAWSFEKYVLSQGLSGVYKIDLLNRWFENWYIPQYVEDELSNYRNNYSPKARLSKTLGEYGLNFIQLIDGCPRVVLNTSKGFEVQYPCLYYIRRLFYDVKLCPYTGNPLYYLNEYGIKMKMMSLKESINRCINSTMENISYCQLNHFHLPFGNLPDGYDTLFNKLVSLGDLSELVRRYAVFHVIYQYRSFDRFVYLDSDCKQENYELDYSLFLHQNSYFLDFHEGKVLDMVRRGVKLSFRCHSAFLDYCDYFDLLDTLNDVVNSEVSNNRKRVFSEKSSHMKRLNAYRYSSCLDFTDMVMPADPVTSSVYPLYEQLSLTV